VTRRAALAWTAAVVPLWIVLILCTHWEPVSHDSWGHVLWHRSHGFSPATVWAFAHDSYYGGNPRLGQVLTLIAFAPGPWHVVVTPLIELGLLATLTALVLGRWPSLRRAEDALRYATITAMVVVGTAVIGSLLCYRPFTGNYLYGLALTLLALVPYRFHAAGAVARWWWVPALLVVGVAAGLSNEHTGPTAIAAMVLAIVVARRRGARLEAWMLVGVVAMTAGYLALFFAPGQAQRYDGLATHAGLLQRILDRGVGDNAMVLLRLGQYASPMLAWIGLALVARRGGGDGLERGPRRILWLMVAAAVAITLTLYASPKLGERLYFASTALLAAAIGGWVVAVVEASAATWPRRVLIGFAVVAIGFFAERMVATYAVAGPEGAARLAAVRAAAPGSTLTLPRFHAPHSRWFQGEDLDGDDKRGDIAHAWGLAAIVLTR
jgi:hypothetical protein